MLLTVIADCIYNYALEDDDGIFTTADIWHYKYAVENVEAIFKKPGVENEAARSEYDKFFQQPMEMLANARILTKTKQGNRNFYRVNNFEVLEYIALRERNALTEHCINPKNKTKNFFGVFRLFLYNGHIKILWVTKS